MLHIHPKLNNYYIQKPALALYLSFYVMILNTFVKWQEEKKKSPKSIILCYNYLQNMHQWIVHESCEVLQTEMESEADVLQERQRERDTETGRAECFM